MQQLGTCSDWPRIPSVTSRCGQSPRDECSCGTPSYNNLCKVSDSKVGDRYSAAIHWIGYELVASRTVCHTFKQRWKKVRSLPHVTRYPPKVSVRLRAGCSSCPFFGMGFVISHCMQICSRSSFNNSNQPNLPMKIRPPCA
jgi:hypothetical protein